MKIILILANRVDPNEMQHFIWVFTVCQSSRYRVSSIQRVKNIVYYVCINVIYLNKFKVSSIQLVKNIVHNVCITVVIYLNKFRGFQYTKG